MSAARYWGVQSDKEGLKDGRRHHAAIYCGLDCSVKTIKRRKAGNA